MDVLNMNEFAVHPRVILADGRFDTITVVPKRRVTLPAGVTVDQNWLSSVSRVSVFGDPRSKQALAASSIPAGAAVVASGSGVPQAHLAPSGASVTTQADINAAQAAALALAVSAAQAAATTPSPAPYAVAAASDPDTQAE